MAATPSLAPRCSLLQAATRASPPKHGVGLQQRFLEPFPMRLTISLPLDQGPLITRYQIPSVTLAGCYGTVTLIGARAAIRTGMPTVDCYLGFCNTGSCIPRTTES